MNHSAVHVFPLLLGIAALAAATGGCSSRSAAGTADAPRHAVHVAAVQVAPLGQAVRVVGLLAPRDQSRLAFKLGGYIDAIPVEEGQQVRAGQLLAALKRTEIDAVLTQARQGGAKAQRDLARARALYADGVATLEQVQDLDTAAEVAAAAERAAEYNARNAEIRAPGDGVVLQKLADVHELVAAGQPVLSIGKAGRGWVVRAGLADRDVVRLRSGDTASIAFDAWPGRRFAGTVGTISAAADPATGTYTVEIPLEPDGAPFVQGLVAKVLLTPRGAPTVPVVPIQALIEANGDEAGVYVLDADGVHVRRVTIRTGRMGGGEVEVRGGVAAGDRVVVDGAAFIENGEAVRVETPS